MKIIPALYEKFTDLVNKEPNPVNRARIKILSHGLTALLVCCICIIAVYAVKHQPLIAGRAGIYLLLFAFTEYMLLFRKAWRLAGHILLLCLLSIILSNMVLYRQGISLLTIQYSLLIISGAFYVLGIRWGLIYAITTTSIIFGYMLVFPHGSSVFFIKASEVNSIGFIIVLAANFVMLVVIHYQFFKSFYQVHDQHKTNEARLLAAMLTVQENTRSRNNFLSSISHELRTPLNAVIGMTNVLLLSSPRKDQEENLSVLQFSAENLLALINDLLDFNKIDAGKVELEARPFQPGPLLHGIFESFELRAAEKQLHYTLDTDATVENMYIMGDQTRLMQILMNLLSNAIKFTAKGSVTLSARLVRQHEENVRLLFTVKDTGSGIPADKQQVIFEPFMQASATIVRQHGGTGLGLPIVKRLLELHGSSIHLKSLPGIGSEFSFEISYPKASAPAPATGPIPILKLPVQQLRILVAEDNEVNAMVMKKILDRLGISYTVVPNGQQAVDAVKKETYHIVFMDIHMPVMDGLEAIRQIRALPDPAQAGVYIIVLSASDEGIVKDTYTYSLINDMLPKPFSLQQLQEKLEKYINHAA